MIGLRIFRIGGSSLSRGRIAWVVDSGADVEERIMSQVVRGVIRGRRALMRRSKRPAMTIHLPAT